METPRTYFIKVRAGLTKGLHPKIITSKGIEFNESFVERLYEVEEELRSKVILPINEAVGLHNWALTFIEHPTEKPIFFADIYAPDSNAFIQIILIIKSTIKDIEFSYYHKGDINTYLNR